jgi:hypothetical protein
MAGEWHNGTFWRQIPVPPHIRISTYKLPRGARARESYTESAAMKCHCAIGAISLTDVAPRNLAPTPEGAIPHSHPFATAYRWAPVLFQNHKKKPIRRAA